GRHPHRRTRPRRRGRGRLGEPPVRPVLADGQPLSADGLRSAGTAGTNGADSTDGTESTDDTAITAIVAIPQCHFDCPPDPVPTRSSPVSHIRHTVLTAVNESARRLPVNLD